METAERWWSGRVMELTTRECWELLEARKVGRVGWNEPEGPEVIPVNYVVRDGAIVFRTTAGSRLAETVAREPLSFQVDDVDEFNQSGWSVLARGRAEFVTADLHPVDLDDPVPWPEGDRQLRVRVAPEQLTGRRLLAS